MSETSPNFNEGDVVWVKLGPCWWPGEVKDQNSLPNEVIDFKKPPLCIVKFFGEDSYEYVKSPQNIYPYNCERKNDFIKKGMASFRAKLVHMQKFPKDVSTAEVMTGGNPNILSEPIFLPEKKINYVAEVFGTPSPKRTPKDGERKKNRSSTAKKDTAHITHRRFLGYDDYEAQICIQYPGKDIVGDTKECEEIIRINKDSVQEFTCQKCNFVTKRLEVMILHTKSHIQGVYDSITTTTTKKSKKSIVKRPRQKKKKIFDSSIDTDSSSDELTILKSPKRKQKSQTGKKSKMNKGDQTLETTGKEVTVSEPVSPTRIRNNLLAEWEDSEEEEELDKTVDASVEILDVPESTVDTGENEEITAEVSKMDNQEDSLLKPSEPSDIKKDIKSCFDFDEEEEEETPIVETAVGRKIPRVIPPSDRRRSTLDVVSPTADLQDVETDPKSIVDVIKDTSLENESTNVSVDEEEQLRTETLKLSESINVAANEDDEKDEEHDRSFKELLDSTSVPMLPDVENTLKCEQNFHDIKTVKFPDKTEPTESSSVVPKADTCQKETVSEVATKLTNPKKRFAKSFEDFEMFQEQRRKAQEEKAEEVKNDLKSSITDETSSSDKDSPVASEELKYKAEEKKVVDEEESKLDFESSVTYQSSSFDKKSPVKSKDESSKLEEEKAEEEKQFLKLSITEESTSSDKNSFIISEDQRHKTQEEKAEEERNDLKPSLMEETSSSDKDSPVKSEDVEQLKISKLKNLMMSKIKTEDEKTKRRIGFHRSPRNKFLELYKKERDEVSIAEEDESNKAAIAERLGVQGAHVKKKRLSAEENREIRPPKKKIWTRRGSDRSFGVSEKPQKEFEPSVIALNEKPVVHEEEYADIAIMEHSTPDDTAEETNKPIEEETLQPVVQTEGTTAEPVFETCDQFNADETVESCIDNSLPKDKLPSYCDKIEETDEKNGCNTATEEPTNCDKSLETDLSHSVLKRAKEDLSALISRESECNKSSNETPSGLAEKSVGDVSTVKLEHLNEIVDSASEISKSLHISTENNIDNLESDLISPSKDLFSSKKETDIYSVMETSSVLPDDAICSPIKKSPKSKTEELSESNFIKKDNNINSDTESIKNHLESNNTEKIENVLEYSFEDSDSQLDKSGEDNNLKQNPIEVKDKVFSCKTATEVETNGDINVKASDELLLKSSLSKVEEISALALASLATVASSLVECEKISPTETVHIDESNLTVVSEKELADGQVEIAASSKKPVTLTNFSMDFTESASDSNSASEMRDILDNENSNSELMKTINEEEVKVKQQPLSNKYERLELLDILEGNSLTPEPPKKEVAKPLPANYSNNDILDFEEHIPSQIVRTKNAHRPKSPAELEPPKEVKSQSKLMTRLTDVKKKEAPKTAEKIKSKPGSKPIILSEKIIKHADTTPSIKKPPVKRPFEDIEDVEAFIIPKGAKKIATDDNEHDKKGAASKSGKAKILQQTIITPEGEIIQPKISQVQTDDNVFDINSMPIVLSDELLTAENIEAMPFVLEESKTTPAKIVTSSIVPKKVVTQSKILSKTPPISVQNPVVKTQTRVVKGPPRILQNSQMTPKIIKHNNLLPSSAKPNKYIIMPQGTPSPVGHIKGRKPTLIKRTIQHPTAIAKPQNLVSESTGNKIMIVTNQQGEQQRLLLTPAQQKMLGCSPGTTKMAKPLVKGNYIQKTIINSKSCLLEAGPSGITKTIRGVQGMGTKVTIGSTSSQISSTGQSLTTIQSRNTKAPTGKFVVNRNQKQYVRQKTILIKNQLGQTVKTIQGTDDELLDKQVAEQLEAIKASSALRYQQAQKQEPYKSSMKTSIKKSYTKKITALKEPAQSKSPVPSTSGYTHNITKPEAALPPLAPISPKKSELTQPAGEKSTDQPAQERPLNQLVIQDALGNQTTITEGQILALPSETVDGQPQSYMLVTLDESGNLTPLNSEALMSLDPNLLGGGDLSNMVLQIDQGTATVAGGEGVLQTQTAVVSTSSAIGKNHVKEPVPKVAIPEVSNSTDIVDTSVSKNLSESLPISEAADMPAISSAPSEAGQQLIVTGDPIATQKFLESLSEGTTDLANILANAEGSSIIIQADGQQILINTNSDNQMMLSLNNDNAVENSESGGNPMFPTQPTKNQDILAAALADTDVFQQDQSTTQSKIHSQLSPGSSLYPMNVSNVLETSLTLSSPIMTPLEVPSTNSKKIPDEEADILTQVPKNVALPITITDPNISQTVAHQQAALLANDLQSNLELTLPISETTICASSSEMNSPSFVYSLPSLDDINQKPFNSSMPLLTEDVEETTIIDNSGAEETVKDSDPALKTDTNNSDSNNDDKKVTIPSVGGFIEEEEGLCTLGGEMCSSLSEPPPDMFDLQAGSFLRNSPRPDSVSNDKAINDEESEDAPSNLNERSPVESNSPATVTSEDSTEIPVQPEIVTELSLESTDSTLKRNCPDEENGDLESKKCKFD